MIFAIKMNEEHNSSNRTTHTKNKLDPTVNSEKRNSDSTKKIIENVDDGDKYQYDEYVYGSYEYYDNDINGNGK